MNIVILPAVEALSGDQPVDQPVGESGGGDAVLAVSALEGVVVVRVDGEIDLHTGPALRAALQELLSPSAVLPGRRPGAGGAQGGSRSAGDGADRVRGVVLDLSEVTFVDSFAVGVLVHGHRLARPGGRAYAVVATHEKIRTLFAVTGLARVLPLHPDVRTALQCLRPANGTVPA